MRIRKNKNKGFTLVEVIGSMLVLSITISSVLTAFSLSAKSNAKTKRIQGAESLMEDLLELARNDNGKSKMVPETLDFSALAEDGMLPFEAVFYERGLTLESDIQPGITLTGSRQHLEQVLDILLDNARKYASTGTVTVTLFPWDGTTAGSAFPMNAKR